MSIDYCMKCDKRLDTDFIEYQEDGTLYCDACLDDMEEAALRVSGDKATPLHAPAFPNGEAKEEV